MRKISKSAKAAGGMGVILPHLSNAQESTRLACNELASMVAAGAFDGDETHRAEALQKLSREVAALRTTLDAMDVRIAGLSIFTLSYSSPRRHISAQECDGYQYRDDAFGDPCLRCGKGGPAEHRRVGLPLPKEVR